MTTIKVSDNAFNAAMAERKPVAKPARKSPHPALIAVGVIAGLTFLGSLLPDTKPVTTKPAAIENVQESTPDVYQALIAKRGADMVCHSGSEACEIWIDSMAQCEGIASGSYKQPCSFAEDLRERVTGISLSTAPGAFEF